MDSASNCGFYFVQALISQYSYHKDFSSDCSLINQQRKTEFYVSYIRSFQEKDAALQQLYV